MKSRFITIHYLYSLAAMCANRDDLNNQKILETLHGVHARVSSQSAKFAWRVSDYFAKDFGHLLSHRTRILGVDLFRELIEAGVKEVKAREVARKVASYFGDVAKKATPEDPDADVSHKNAIHYSRQEYDEIIRLAVASGKKGKVPTKEEVVGFSRDHKNIDIALWGRCLTVKEEGVDFSADSSCSVAHEITVHTLGIENDYFTTVDTLNDRNGRTGAAYIGNTGYGHGVFYGCIAIDRVRLLENLCGDQKLMNEVLKALIQVIAKVRAGGKKTSFNNQTAADYICAVASDSPPINLGGLFVSDPVRETENVMEAAVSRIREQIEGYDHAYDLDPVFDKVVDLYVPEKTTRLSEVLDLMVAV